MTDVDTRLDAALEDWATTREAPPTMVERSRVEVAAILARRDERKRSRPVARALVGVAAALLVAIGAIVLRAPPEAPAPEPVVQVPPRRPLPQIQPEVLYEEGTGTHGLELATSGRLVAAVGTDRIALSGPSRVGVSARGRETTLDLAEGLVAAEVASRGDDGFFRVRAGAVDVVVVGTRFAVERTGGVVFVSVEEGTVQVEMGALPTRERWTVEAGETLTVGARVVRGSLEAADGVAMLLRPEPMPELEPPAPAPRLLPPPAGPTVSDLRGLLLAGELDAAEAGLADHVARWPLDLDAWSLLATARRKQGDRPGAIEALDALAARSVGGTASRARYEAASLHQQLGHHQEALALLDTIVVDPSLPEALLPDTLLRSGQAHLALGRRGEARALFELVVRRFPGTAPANAASQLIQNETL